jgi:SAM domain (Sterile alpha motif)
MDTAEWLRGLGLEQYANAFRENSIDAEVLCDLTAEDLKELGVGPIGHRRRLLTAIAALRAQAPDGGSPLPNPPSYAGEGRVGPGQKPSGGN